MNFDKVLLPMASNCLSDSPQARPVSGHSRRKKPSCSDLELSGAYLPFLASPSSPEGPSFSLDQSHLRLTAPANASRRASLPGQDGQSRIVRAPAQMESQADLIAVSPDLKRTWPPARKKRWSKAEALLSKVALNAVPTRPSPRRKPQSKKGGEEWYRRAQGKSRADPAQRSSSEMIVDQPCHQPPAAKCPVCHLAMTSGRALFAPECGHFAHFDCVREAMRLGQVACAQCSRPMDEKPYLRTPGTSSSSSDSSSDLYWSPASSSSSSTASIGTNTPSWLPFDSRQRMPASPRGYFSPACPPSPRPTIPSPRTRNAMSFPPAYQPPSRKSVPLRDGSQLAEEVALFRSQANAGQQEAYQVRYQSSQQQYQFVHQQRSCSHLAVHTVTEVAKSQGGSVALAGGFGGWGRSEARQSSDTSSSRGCHLPGRGASSAPCSRGSAVAEDTSSGFKLPPITSSCTAGAAVDGRGLKSWRVQRFGGALRGTSTDGASTTGERQILEMLEGLGV